MAERRFPVWLLGFSYMPMGIFGAVVTITVPQLLAANGVPEPQIASVTAIALIPLFCNILIAPMLDWRFTRRFYAIAFILLAALMQFAALLAIHHLGWLTLLLVLQALSVSLAAAAIGGWLGNLVRVEDKNRLAAWFTAANLGTGGMTAILAIFLLRRLPIAEGAGLLSLLLFAPLPLFIALPAPPADKRLASESFRHFFLDVIALLRSRTVLWTVLLFVMPVASFALSNTLGGLGRDFGASEHLVSIVAGTGVTFAGVFGSLIVPRLIGNISPRIIYLLIGGFGALFTFALIGLPRTPLTFALVMVGENGFQAASFSVQYAIILRTIGENNPFAATQFALLSAATMVPLTYMQAIDGNAYGIGGLAGSYLADGLLSFGASAALALLFWFANQNRLSL